MQRKVPGMLKQRKAHWLAEVSHSLISAHRDYHNTISRSKSECKYCTLNPVVNSKCWNTTQNNRSVKKKTTTTNNCTAQTTFTQKTVTDHLTTQRQTDTLCAHAIQQYPHSHLQTHIHTHIKQSSGQPTNKLTSQHTHTQMGGQVTNLGRPLVGRVQSPGCTYSWSCHQRSCTFHCHRHGGPSTHPCLQIEHTATHVHNNMTQLFLEVWDINLDLKLAYAVGCLNTDFKEDGFEEEFSF